MQSDRHSITSFIDFESCRSIVKGWIQDCVQAHPNCGSVIMQQAPLPKRSLHLDPQTASIQLCLTEGQQGSYVTLSYCWGGYTACRTTKENIGARMAGIAYDDLPETFQDVVAIAMGIGINYVWIDSLCIVQDDQDDWEIESAKMATVYSQAYLNVSAAASTSPRGVCFGRRAEFSPDGLWRQGVPPVLTPWPRTGIVSAVQDTNQIGTVTVREVLPHDHLEIGAATSSANRMPLFQRAWAFQERLLSPRTLHFTGQEMMWECRASTRCECGGLESRCKPAGHTTDWASNFKANIYQVLEAEENDSSYKKLQMQKLWHLIVDVYSLKILTYERDRLVALSAVAELMEGPELGKYVAGIWTGDLPQALAWRSLLEGNIRATEYRAPSWSWAALEGPVTYISSANRFAGPDTYLSPLIKAEATVTNISFSPATSNRFANLALSASLTIYAPLVPARLRRNEGLSDSKWVDSSWILESKGLCLGFLPDTLCDCPSGSECFECTTMLLGESETGRPQALVLRQPYPETESYIRIGVMKGSKYDYKSYEGVADFNKWEARLFARFQEWFGSATMAEIIII